MYKIGHIGILLCIKYVYRNYYYHYFRAVLCLYSPHFLAVSLVLIYCILAKLDLVLEYACPVWHSSLTVAQTKILESL